MWIEQGCQLYPTGSKDESFRIFHSKMTEVSKRCVHKEGVITPSMGRIGPVRASANKTREATAEHKYGQLQLAETLPRYTHKR